MANTLPITIELSALPPSISYTPQQFGDALAARMYLVTEQAFSLFVSGSTAPLSNVGPWLKDDMEWWVWSDTEGAYVPITANQQTLEYFIGSTTPDKDVYQFWIQTNGGGQPQALKIWYNGAWTDVYAQTLASYATVAQMNTAIAAAQGRQAFKVGLAADQDVVCPGAGTIDAAVGFDTEVYDPDDSYENPRFTAQLAGYYTFKGVGQSSVSAGSPTSIAIGFYFAVNGVAAELFNSETTLVETGTRINVGVADFYLNPGDYVEMRVGVTVDAAATIEINNDYSRFSGYRFR